MYGKISSLSYKGAMFEGEKYLGTTDDSIDVVSIFVWVKDETKLQGFTKDDFHFLASEILIQLPKSYYQLEKPNRTTDETIVQAR